MKSRLAVIGIHVTSCILFLSLPFFLSPDGPDNFSAFWSNPESKRELLRYSLFILFFYFNYYYLAPKFYFTKRFLGYFILLSAIFLFILFTPALLLPGNGPRPQHGNRFTEMPALLYNDLVEEIEGPNDMAPGPPPSHRKPPKYNMRSVIFLFAATFFSSLFLRIRSQWSQAEEEKKAAELLYLKTQINPHFLFNSLNSVYSLAVTGSAETADAIVKLSGMMRYVLTDTTNNYVPLNKELGYIDDYISFFKLRFGNDVVINYNVTGKTDGLQIAPMLLIPFIENTFKYGINTEEEMQINISITIENKVLTLKTYNKKVFKKVNNPLNNGIGIMNTRKRLKVLYPDNHLLLINDNETDYILTLTLHLNDAGHSN